MSSTNTEIPLQGYDEEQIRLMEERLILVNESDQNVGSDTKKNCHLITSQNEGRLHRAFSVFIFDSQNRLLLQQRAEEKITFPNYFTNTCCSHPLSFPAEIDEANQLGVKRAAIRKLEHELGITKDQIPIDNIKYLTRILYKSPSDSKWIEHEMDYILLVKADVTLNINPNEIKSFRYVTPAELDTLFKDAEATSTKPGSEKILITPWFRLIYNNFLLDWWKNIDNIHSISQDDTIHNMIK
ncbi:hypothetical protein BB561_003333 [Smittium simulii]|uniref:isopentenyl-diphosphate Delta-isomerase n=1 Tax=Smittium simulii TaxID=133385 RepID=A0A2T9YLY8_9FUNG|nr:hypothetical protein BB561_003333 [Smittium simulii]